MKENEQPEEKWRYNSEKKKVLVLDDDKHMVDLISDVLRDITVVGDVHGVSDIEHAMSLLECENYSAILSDIQLNSFDGANGIDFIKDVLTLYGEKYQNKIIVVSGDCDSMGYALKSGASVGINKPFDIDDLKDKVSKILMSDEEDSN